MTIPIVGDVSTALSQAIRKGAPSFVLQWEEHRCFLSGPTQRAIVGLFESGRLHALVAPNGDVWLTRAGDSDEGLDE